MQVHPHPGRTAEQRARFAALVRPLLSADRVRHTVALSVLHQLENAELDTDGPGTEPVLLSVHDGPQLVGAALRTPPHPLISSALDPTAAVAVLRGLAEHDPELPGFTGPAEVTEALVAAAGWHRGGPGRRVGQLGRRGLAVGGRWAGGVAGQGRATVGGDQPHRTGAHPG